MLFLLIGFRPIFRRPIQVITRGCDLLVIRGAELIYCSDVGNVTFIIPHNIDIYIG